MLTLTVIGALVEVAEVLLHECAWLEADSRHGGFRVDEEHHVQLARLVQISVKHP